MLLLCTNLFLLSHSDGQTYDGCRKFIIPLFHWYSCLRAAVSSLLKYFHPIFSNVLNSKERVASKQYKRLQRWCYEFSRNVEYEAMKHKDVRRFHPLNCCGNYTLFLQWFNFHYCPESAALFYCWLICFKVQFILPSVVNRFNDRIFSGMTAASTQCFPVMYQEKKGIPQRSNMPEFEERVYTIWDRVLIFGHCML